MHLLWIAVSGGAYQYSLRQGIPLFKYVVGA